ncbi:MAG TPA: SCO family protein [Polyangia bacterium]|jgi:protein SCO1/2
MNPPPASTETVPAGAATPTRPRAGWAARLLGRPVFWVVAVSFLFGVPLGRSFLRRVPAAPPVLGTVPAFALTDQAGRRMGTAELQGKVWVADFIFTSCQEACPLLSQKMAEVMRRARLLGPDFHLVSLTVDPERDTPARLAEYGARFGANPQKWSFLTGPMDVIEGAVVDGFKEGLERTPARVAAGTVADPAGPTFWEIFHGEHLVLVDRQLRIRGYFSATPEGLDQLMEAIGLIINNA